MVKLFRAAVLMASCLTAIVAAELILRASGYQYSPLQIGANVKDDWREQHAFRDRHLVYDPDLIWRPISGQFSPFNPQGFRGAPIDTVKPAGTLRVIALGDSNTFGWSVDEGANWPSRLERLIAASGRKVEVINAGVWGYSSYQGRQRFRELLPLNPDLVLVSFGGNDAHQVLVPDATYVERHDRIERLTRASKRLRIAQLLVAAWDRVEVATGASGTLGPRVSLEDYAAHLREMIRTGRERGTSVVLLTRPFVGTSTDPASWKTHAPAYNAVTSDVARAENAPVIDIYSAFRDCSACFDDEAHFGVEGHRRAAEMIYGRLTDLIGR